MQLNLLGKKKAPSVAAVTAAVAAAVGFDWSAPISNQSNCATTTAVAIMTQAALEVLVD